MLAHLVCPDLFLGRQVYPLSEGASGSDATVSGSAPMTHLRRSLAHSVAKANPSPPPGSHSTKGKVHEWRKMHIHTNIYIYINIHNPLSPLLFFLFVPTVASTCLSKSAFMKLVSFSKAGTCWSRKACDSHRIIPLSLHTPKGCNNACLKSIVSKVGRWEEM